jgi:hypothetical protein
VSTAAAQTSRSELRGKYNYLLIVVPPGGGKACVETAYRYD